MEKKKLTRSTTDAKLAGVCGGIAEYFGIDAGIVRMVYAAFTFFSAGFGGVFVYLLLAFVLPKDNRES